MWDELSEVLREISVVDVLDIAFISVLLYVVLTWIRQTTSRSVYVGLSIVAGLYLLTRAFNLYMTTMFFHAVFTVVLVALVVVFQEDLRRVFERIGTLGQIGSPRRQTAFEYIDTLVEVTNEFASKRIGALIALKGREPLDRHIDGGVQVNGDISKPLLDSIFDPHSMGHDGAVTIENQQIKLFAAHLPLSKNLDEVGSRGTRHSAAIGLSEVTDALVIVTSEERGQTSIAKGGKLRLVQGPAELQRQLEAFCQEKFPSRAEQFWRPLLKQHAALKVASVVIACIGWLFLSHRAPIVQQSFAVPVEFRSVPEKIVLEDPVSQVRVTLSGRDREFALLSPSALKVSLDMKDIGDGTHRVLLQDEHVRRPINLTVSDIEPRTLRIDVHALVPSQLAIQVQTEGQLPAGLELKRLQTDPSSVRAMVWRDEREKARQLFTEPIDLSKITTTMSVEATFNPPRYVQFTNGKPPAVRIAVEVTNASQEPHSGSKIPLNAP